MPAPLTYPWYPREMRAWVAILACVGFACSADTFIDEDGSTDGSDDSPTHAEAAGGDGGASDGETVEACPGQGNHACVSGCVTSGECCVMPNGAMCSLSCDGGETLSCTRTDDCISAGTVCCLTFNVTNVCPLTVAGYSTACKPIGGCETSGARVCASSIDCGDAGKCVDVKLIGTSSTLGVCL